MGQEKDKALQQIPTRETPGTTVLLEMEYRYTNYRSYGSGSGFFIATDKIATNIHVLAGAKKVTVTQVSTATVYTIEGIAAFDDKNDLVVLKVAEEDTPFPLGDSDAVQVGDTVYTVGYPESEESRAEGTIHKIRDSDKWIELNIPEAGPGYSGAPVLNSRGEVIAIMNRGYDKFGEAIPANRLKALLTDTARAEAGTSIRHPAVRSWIGNLFHRRKSAPATATEDASQKPETVAALLVESLATWRKRPRIRAYTQTDHGDKKVAKGKYKGAVAAYSKAIKLNPDLANFYKDRGDAKEALGDVEGAIEDYDNAIRLNLEYTVVYHNRAIAKEAVGDVEGAIEDYDNAIRLNPEYTGAYNNRGVAKRAFGDVEGAIEDYDNAIRLNPENAGAYNNRGVAKRALGDIEGAIEDYDNAIRLNPENAGAYNNRGVAKRALGDVEGAIEDYDNAIRLNPEYTGAYNNRGVAKRALGDVEGAIEDYDNAIRLNPEDADTYNSRGDAKRALGDVEGAIEDYDNAIRLNPEDANAYNNWGWTKYLLGQLEAEQGNRAEAQRLYQAAVSDTDEALRLESKAAKLRSATYHTRGAAKAALEDHNGAIEDFDESICLNPEKALLYHDRGLSKEALGQQDAAAADFQKAKALDPDFEK